MTDALEQKRLAALREFEIMDTPPEEAFDDITRLTSFICGTPIALITLLDNRRQWFKSKVGLTGSETPLEHAFCAYAIRQQNIMMVHDALEDVRFANYPSVTNDPHIRFYAGAPLITRDGVALGTLCAVDREPRTFTLEQEEALTALARQVIRSLELRRTVKALEIALEEKSKAQREVASLQELLPMCTWCRKVRDDERFWHKVEDYLCAHSEVRYTHGVCPDCFARLSAEEGEPNCSAKI